MKISSPGNSRQSYRAGYTQSTNIHVISNSRNAINLILMEDRHPYWTFNWTASGLPTLAHEPMFIFFAIVDMIKVIVQS